VYGRKKEINTFISHATKIIKKRTPGFWGIYPYRVEEVGYYSSAVKGRVISNTNTR